MTAPDMTFVKRLLFLFIILLAFTHRARAQQPCSDSVITYRDQPSPLVISDKVCLLEDSTGKMSINDIAANAGFKHTPTPIPNLNVTSSTVWVKFNLTNKSNHYWLYLEIDNALLDDVTLYSAKDSTGKFAAKSISKSLPFASRGNNNQNYLFEIYLPPGKVTTYYLKVKSYAQLIIPMKIGNYESISNADLNRDILSALYLGIMLVMVLYNFFVYISVRDKSYLYYICYIISVALVQLNITGLGFKYLWPDSPRFEQYSVYLFSAFTAFASIAFITQFLNTKTFLPKLHKGFIVFILAYVVTICVAFWGNKHTSYNLLNVNALPLSLYMIAVAAVIRVKYKYRPANFFLVAWTIFLTSIILFVLKDVGVLPYNLLTVSVLQIGSAAEVVLLSIALADRINTLKREKEASQAQALEAAQENARIVRDQNVMLENKVNERTIELRAANGELNKAMNELKEAQTQLVESEKMASLGQLTAGIAHEINNPINFVTSNVKPLKRDVEILLEAVGEMEKLSLSDISVAEKEKHIDSYKTDIDFDYLKVEINHLLKGIGEGASRTAEIVKGLRIFSRLDEDDLKRADINEGLDSTLVIINNLVGNIELVKKYGNIPLVECYPGKLNQVFLNMITNAIYAINKQHNGQPGGRLEISTTHDETHVFIRIADNGTGMSESTKKKLFEPFFTTKDVGEGTGLGMSIAYNTINKHNGRIIVNSTLGEGTEFIIEIPMKH